MENQVDVTDGRGCGVTQSELFNPAEQAAQAAAAAGRGGASPPVPISGGDVGLASVVDLLLDGLTAAQTTHHPVSKRERRRGRARGGARRETAGWCRR